MQARHKLDIKRFLEESEYDINLFEFESKDKFRIKIVQSELKFEIVQDQRDFNLFKIYHSAYKPGYPLIAPLATNIHISIHKVKTQLETWLKAVVEPYLEEIEYSQKWNSFESKGFFGSSFDKNLGDDTYLDPNEVISFKNAINQIKDEIKNEFAPTLEISETINKKLDYLVESTDRLNRYDLRGAIFSIFISICVNLTVSTEQGYALFRIFQKAFNSVPMLFEFTKIYLQSKFGG